MFDRKELEREIRVNMDDFHPNHLVLKKIILILIPRCNKNDQFLKKIRSQLFFKNSNLYFVTNHILQEIWQFQLILFSILILVMYQASPMLLYKMGRLGGLRKVSSSGP